MHRLSRRGVLIGMASGTALAASGTAAAVERGAISAPGVSGQAPWWMIHPLQPGARLAGGWRVGDLSPVRKGASVLTLVDPEGKPVEVHLCTHEGRPKGIVSTALVDVVLMDGSAGNGRTDERLGRILKDIARRIRKNEVAGEADLLPVSTMLPHGDRVMAYGPDNL